MDNKTKGKIGEDICCDYLLKKGYSILNRNYRCKSGEIDVIAKKEDTIHFVEVKARNGEVFGTPAMAVDKRKQKKIIRAAYSFIYDNQINNMNYLFDVCEVFLGNNRVNYIVNAFDVTSE